NSNGHPVLPCASCVFKEWGKTDSGRAKPPPCSEQFTLPLLYTTDSGESWVTGILTLQRTGIKPTKQYMASFVQRTQPLFSVMTRITLNQLSRGTVQYSVPAFQQIGPTDPNSWGEYAAQMVSARSFLR